MILTLRLRIQFFFLRDDINWKRREYYAVNSMLKVMYFCLFHDVLLGSKRLMLFSGAAVNPFVMCLCMYGCLCAGLMGKLR